MQNTISYLQRARLLLNQKRPQDALAQLKTALEMEPENAEALGMMGNCYYDLGQFEKGIQIIESAIALDPDESYHFYLLGYGYYKTHRHIEAINAFDTSLSLNPYFVESYGIIAHIKLEEKKFEEGLQKANEGLAIDPENLTCLNARSIALNKQHKTAEAIETMQDALAQDPENEYTHCTVGWNYLEKGRHKTATYHFKEALRLNPNYSSAQAGLKESLKSKIAPYRWMLQYSFWLNNKGKKMRWIIPIGLYLAVRVLTGILKYREGSEGLITVIVSIYLLFVVTSWLIVPLANFFLMFHKDGKYALTETEKKTSLTVVIALFAGTILLCVNLAMPDAGEFLSTALTIATIALWAMSVPLGNIEYPLSFTRYGNQNKIALVLTSLAMATVILAFAFQPAAYVTGVLFLILFILNNWMGVFK